MVHTRTKLHYGQDELANFGISSKTVDLHFNKHHQAYVNNLNNLIEQSDKNLHDLSLEAIITYANEQQNAGIFNNAGQHWNHELYWKSMSPKTSLPCQETQKLIDHSFGSMDALKKAFLEAGMTVFGSGWAWLSFDSNHKNLIVSKTANGAPVFVDNPNHQALIGCDVWEHAYYLDHQNLRAKYLEGFWSAINWRFVSEQLDHRA